MSNYYDPSELSLDKNALTDSQLLSLFLKLLREKGF